MLLPISWLQQYLPKLPPVQKLADLLLMHGLEVEAVVDRAKDFDKVVVGEIVDIKTHPNADKLRLAHVITAPGGQLQEIVCGAPNIVIGQKVPVALLGAKLPNGLTIAKRAIRGVESNGMLCAEDELGLGKSHAGILVLDPVAKVGTPFAEAMGFNDIVFDLAIPANRADLMGVRGLAWEIGAMLGKIPKFSREAGSRPPLRKNKEAGQAPKLKEASDQIQKVVTVKIADPKLCPVYTARYISGVTLKPSPAWLQQRLRAAGMRPINAVVDATNYIMLAYGQPLHAFDAAHVGQGKIIVRSATADESLKTLDGQIRPLDPSMLVIADPNGPIALAGVMGGASSEVTQATTNIILEAAIFDPVSIRKTSRRLGLVSEASKRFEKGLWASLPERASAAAAALIVELCGGTVAKGSVGTTPARAKATTIRLSPKYISERLGQTVAPAAAKKILSALGFTVKGSATWGVTVPEWRMDVTIPDDIVDEVGRLTGYDDLPNVMPPLNVAPESLPAMLQWKDELRQALVSLGFTEIITHSYYNQRAKDLIKGDHVEVANPLDTTQQYLRRSLFPSVMHVLEASVDAGRDAKVFEISRVFDVPKGDQVEKFQPWKIILGLAFKAEEGYAPGHRLEKIQEELFTLLGIPASDAQFQSDAATKGRVREYLELDVADLLQSRAKKGKTEIEKYPPVTRDISFWWTGDEVTLKSTIADLAVPLLRHFTRKDKFTKGGRTSYAYTFVYQSPERTLTKAEVDVAEQAIKTALIAKGATIR